MRAKYNENIDNVLYATDFGEVYQHVTGTHIAILSFEQRNQLNKTELISYFNKLKNSYQQLPFDFKILFNIDRNFLLIKAIGKILFSKLGVEIEYVNKNIEEIICDNSIFVCNHRSFLDIPLW